MKLAVIDLGTNTFHLLLAEIEGSGFRVLRDLKIPVKIGEGGISQNTISDDAIERALETLESFRSILNQEGVDRISATATSAFRSANNGLELISTIRDQTGITIKTISGREEAELIYRGVNLALDQKMDDSLIMDIGGGSVEFILANSAEIFWLDSFEVGAQRLMDRFHYSDPINSNERIEMDQYLTTKLEPLWQQARQFGALTLVGSSGTFDTLIDIAYLANGEDKPARVTHFELKRDEFLAIYNQIISKTRSERAAIPGMIEMRVDMIVVACCLINLVLNNIDIKSQILVSTYALKEGVLASQLKLSTE